MEGLLTEIKTKLNHLSEQLDTKLQKTEDRIYTWIGADLAAEKYASTFMFKEALDRKFEPELKRKREEADLECQKKIAEIENDHRKNRLKAYENDPEIKKLAIDNLMKDPKIIREAKEMAEENYRQMLITSGNLLFPMPPSHENGLKIAREIKKK
jgi:hypothetical protein